MTSIPKLFAAPPSTDAPANPATPMRNAGFRPKRSASRPPSRSSEAKASAYAVTIHWRLPSEKPRSACADGRAMFTMVASSTTISCAIATIERIHHRFADDGAPGRSAVPLPAPSDRVWVWDIGHHSRENRSTV